MTVRIQHSVVAAHLAMFIVLLLALPATGQTTQPGAQPPPAQERDSEPPLAPAAALGRLLATLTNEGEQFAETGNLPRAYPSIASEFPHELPEVRLSKCITERQHRDPLVDAYIRWQLTSFSPQLPIMRVNHFAKVLDDLPPLSVNPRANEQLIVMMNRAIDAGELNEPDQQTITAALNEMEEAVAQRRDINTPAMELRDWLAEQCEDDSARQILLALERCNALVSAGWTLGRFGPQTEQLFMDAARDREFTDDDRRLVTRAAQRVSGTARVYVRSARINQNRIEVNFGDTGIYEFDVRRWLRRLDGK